jgi:crotonobetainyl-CoA:carnitine CoA-transferase CaiB-like acyl-CoA transferase
VPSLIADKVGGLHLALAVLAGLASRNREGKAVAIEAPMLESIASFLLVEHLGGLSFDPPLGPPGYERLLSPDRRPFATRDGWIAVIPYNGAHWASFLALIGRDDLVDDPRVRDPVQRSRSINMLYGLIADAMPDRTTTEWLELLRDRDIPCAAVNQLADLPRESHLADVGLFRRMIHPSEGELVSVRTPFSVDGSAGAADRAAPRLGEHSRSILADLGYTDAETAALIEGGIVRCLEEGR